MKKTLLVLILFGINFNLSFAQSNFDLTELDSLNHNRIYQIEIGDNQIVELIETKNSEYKGTLTNKVWKTNRKGIRKKEILNKIGIPELMTKRLINSFREDGIDNLVDCKTIGNCPKGADGTTITFRSYSNGILNVASFWSLHSDTYYKKNIGELYLQIVKARKVFSHIKSEFDLQKLYNDFIKRLPIGTYAYGMIILTKR